MGRTVRYLSRYILSAAAAMTGIFSVVCFFLALPFRTDESLFARYYGMSPVLAVFCLLLFWLTVGGYYGRTAISMGASRRSFFWGAQAVLVLGALLTLALVALSLFLPGWFRVGWLSPPIPPAFLPLFLGLILFSQELGFFLSFFVSRSRWLMVLAFLIATLILGVGTVLFLLGTRSLLPVLGSAWVTAGIPAGAVALGALSWLPLSKFTVR